MSKKKSTTKSFQEATKRTELPPMAKKELNRRIRDAVNKQTDNFINDYNDQMKQIHQAQKNVESSQNVLNQFSNLHNLGAKIYVFASSHFLSEEHKNNPEKQMEAFQAACETVGIDSAEYMRDLKHAGTCLIHRLCQTALETKADAERALDLADVNYSKLQTLAKLQDTEMSTLVGITHEDLKTDLQKVREQGPDVPLFSKSRNFPDPEKTKQVTLGPLPMKQKLTP